MAILWTGIEHDTPGFSDLERDYNAIEKAGKIAKEAVLSENIELLAQSIQLSYQVQQCEGMKELLSIDKSIAKKYCGGGHGGYALYLFNSTTDRDSAVEELDALRSIEPYCR